MGLWHGVPGACDNNEDDDNDGGEGCDDSHVLLMSIMSQTDVGPIALTTRGSDSDKISLSVRVRAKLGPSFPPQGPVALGRLVIIGYAYKLTTLPPPCCLCL